MMYQHESTGDQFLDEQILQPKIAVADYVAAQGFNVPECYHEIDGGLDMLSRGKTVIARSEHPDEYAGPSGLSESRVIMPFSDAARSLMRFTVNAPLDTLHQYAVSAGQDPQTYAQEASHSYWEYIPGTNITIVADDTVHGRYHMFGMSHNDSDDGPPMNISGALVDGAGVIQKLGENYHGDALGKMPRKELINLYEQIRNLGKFDPNHCPIMEMQVSEDGQNIYFLQYHRSRDGNLSSPSLDPKDFDPRENWFPLQHVRGAHLGGKLLKLTLAYKDVGDHQAEPTAGAHEGYFGRGDAYEHIGELASRQRIADINPQSFNDTYTNIASSHAQRSRMFKPQVSAVLPAELAAAAVPNKTVYAAEALSKLMQHDIGIEAEVVSDGHTGYIRPHQHLTIV